MKVLLKKFTVLAAAFAMLFAISACKDPNGAANPDKKGTEPATTTDTTTTTTTDTTTTDTTTTDTTTTDTTTTDPSNNNGQNGGGQGTQSHNVLYDYEDLGTSFTTLFILEGNAWVMEMHMFGSSMDMARGTYTGNLSADGEVVFTKTKEADSNGNLIDCEPETQTLTIKDGIIDFYDEENDGHTYYVRKSRVAENYTTIDVSEPIFIEYKFYKNDTFRLYSDGKLIFLGDYDGDPSVDGDISLTPKYKYEDGVLSEQTGEVQTITINDSSFTGANGNPAYKEVAVFKAEEDDRDPTLVKFYSNNKFLVTCLDLQYNFEISLYFGECDAIPDSTVEGSQTINFSTTYKSDKGKWEKQMEADEGYLAGSLTIENNQFELMNLTFIRQ